MSTASPAVELSKTIGGDGAGVLAAGKTLALSPSAYDGIGSPFASVDEIVDDLGNVQALHWYDGAMNPKHNALTAFKVTAPTIVDNCVRKLLVRVAAANWCDVKKNATNDIKGPYLQPKDAMGRLIPDVSGILDNGGVQRNKVGAKYYTTMPKGNGDNNRADFWFQNIEGGSKNFADIDTQSSWATMTVNNAAADITACTTAGGTLVDVIVEPTGVAFDTFLTGVNTQPFTLGTSNF
jgi:hypothetical protein